MTNPKRRWKGERLNERACVCLTPVMRAEINDIAARRGLGEGETIRLLIAGGLALNSEQEADRHGEER